MRNGKDFRKITNGQYGAINFNNMIPVVDEVLIYIDINSIEDSHYKNLLGNQYRAISADAARIKQTAKNIHDLLMKNGGDLSDYERKVKERCCDLQLLEKVYSEYKV